MERIAAFKQSLARASALQAKGDFDGALDIISEMRAAWPGNAHLHVLWAELVQLQETPTHSLNDAKLALQNAMALDPRFAAGAVELAYFLDNVEDTPRGAAKVFEEAARVARRSLIEAQIGQAKSLIQIGKKKAALACLLEALELSHADKSDGNFAAEVDQMLDELLISDSPANGHAQKVTAKA